MEHSLAALTILTSSKPMNQSLSPVSQAEHGTVGPPGRTVGRPIHVLATRPIQWNETCSILLLPKRTLVVKCPAPDTGLGNQALRSWSLVRGPPVRTVILASVFGRRPEPLSSCLCFLIPSGCQFPTNLLKTMAGTVELEPAASAVTVSGLQVLATVRQSAMRIRAKTVVSSVFTLCSWVLLLEYPQPFCSLI
jgi:hypothetical protein